MKNISIFASTFLLIALFFVGLCLKSLFLPSPQQNQSLQLKTTLKPAHISASISKTRPSKDSSSTKASDKQIFESFKKILDGAWLTLPRQDGGPANSAEVSENIGLEDLEKYRALSDIVEAVDKEPALIPQAFDFYTKCAQGDYFNHVTRARCLSKMRTFSPQLGARAKSQLQMALNSVPEEVKNLSEWLPN